MNPILLIEPSAETFVICGAKHLDILIESVNEGWTNSLPLTGTYPQYNYSVGFKREAFTKRTKDQLDKLSPFISYFIATDQSFFITNVLYVPAFLSFEVTWGVSVLDIADRQNAHSMTP
jgi:hypothetical protein